MTLRDAIEGLLGPTTQRPAADALADEGHDDLSSELFGTALGHYADTAPIEHADALAPIVTRASSVPYEADDLPDSDLPMDDDPLALFDAADPAAMLAEAADDAADDAFDEAADAPDAGEAVEDLTETADGPFADFGDDFGDDTDFGDETAFGDDTDFDDETDLDDLVGTVASADQPTAGEDFGGGSVAEAAQATLEDPMTEAPATQSLDEFDDLPTSFEAPTDGLDISGGLGLGDDLDAAEEATSLFSTDFSDTAGDGVDPDDLDLDFDA